MISMAVASLVLPFLPMLATQVLLNNLLSDLPMLAVSTDRMDPELLARPRRWDFLGLIKAMIGFGLISSIFDAITFVALLVAFHGSQAIVQTGWFMESLLTELVIVAVMRTRRSVFTSTPGRLLMYTSIAVVSVTLLVPYLPFSGIIGFVPLDMPVLLTVLGIVGAYATTTELLKGPIDRLRLPRLLSAAARPVRSRRRR
jgi:Mg2+-importing ATPase